MKKLLMLILIFLLTACSNNKLPNISSEYILENINKEITFDSAIKQDMKQQSIAERYGISPKDIENGIVYYSEDENESDKIVIVKASSKDTVENIERALASEIVSILDAWKDNSEEMEKIENHIFKTKDIYIIMAISNNVEKIEKIFDNCLKG